MSTWRDRPLHDYLDAHHWIEFTFKSARYRGCDCGKFETIGMTGRWERSQFDTSDLRYNIYADSNDKRVVYDFARRTADFGLTYDWEHKK